MDAYPVTTKFIMFQKESLPAIKTLNQEHQNQVGAVMQATLEMLGEYEHGSIDWDVVLKMVGMETEAEWIKRYYHGDTNRDEDDSRAQELQNKALNILREIYEDIISTMITH